MNKKTGGDAIAIIINFLFGAWFQEIVPFLACVGSFLAMSQYGFSFPAALLSSFGVYSILSSLARISAVLIEMGKR